MNERLKNHFYEDFTNAINWIRVFLGNVWMLLRDNFFLVLSFTVLTTIISYIVTHAVGSLFINITMIQNNVTYITPANLSALLLNPTGMNLLMVFLIIVTLLSLFEVGGLLHCYSMTMVGRDTDLLNMVSSGISTCQKALNPQNWGLLLYFIILLPVTHLMNISTATITLSVPGFIEQHLQQHSLNNYYLIFYTFLVMVEIIFVFAINIFVMQNSSFFKSCSRSRRLQKGNYIKTVFSLALLSLLLSFAINTLSGAITVNIAQAMDFFNMSDGRLSLNLKTGEYTFLITRILRCMFSPAINNAGLTVLFFNYIEEKQIMNKLNPRTFNVDKAPKRLVIPMAVIVVLLAAYSMTSFLSQYYLWEPVQRPMVCAHRGDNFHAPENTMPAFELAYYENLPWIELDVHQTSDGVIVVSHDPSLKRTTGHDIYIRDISSSELKNYYLLDSFPGDYEDVQIPTLDEVFKLIKDSDMNVQVEIKGSASDKDLEANILKVINDNDMHDRVLIICLDYQRIVNIKKLDPTILTAYCMTLAIGNIEDVPYTDFASVEENSVTARMVENVHRKGGLVFCWTVDKEDNIQYLVSCGVDVIGTDDPLMVSSALDKVDYSGGISRIINLMIHSLAIGT